MTDNHTMCPPCNAAYDRWLFYRWPQPTGWIEGTPGTDRAERLSNANYAHHQEHRATLVRESLAFIRRHCTGPGHASPYTNEGRNKP